MAKFDANEQNALRRLTATHALHAFEGSRYDSVTEDGQSRVAKISTHIHLSHTLIVRHSRNGKPNSVC